MITPALLRARAPWLVLLLAPTAVSAHMAEAASGLVSGLLHPVFGLDHFLAMLSIGIVSAQLGGRWIYAIPALFVAAMVVGGGFGMYGAPWSLAEAGIALSVVVLGWAVMVAHAGQRVGPVIAITLLFGSLHGHAHGLEMPRAADPVFYAGGFVISTSVIHLLGVLIGHVLTRTELRLRWLRRLGAAAGGVGMLILVRLVAAAPAG